MQTSTWQLFRGLLLGLVGLLAAHPAGAQRIAASFSFALMVRADGSLWGWGDNRGGQLGTAIFSSPDTPVQVGLVTNWLSVSTSGHVVALRTDGTLWTWGVNNRGQLGNGYYGSSTIPEQVLPGTTWRSAAAGGPHTVAVRADGTLWAWGDNYYGQAGVSPQTPSFAIPQPQQIGTATNWASVRAGDGFSLGLRADGTLWAWGDNHYGQLGLGTTTNQFIPTQVGTATWRSIAAGTDYVLAVRQDGTLWTWGSNASGQLGDGTTTYHTSPAQVGTAATWQQVSAGDSHSLAVRQDGTLWAWGSNRTNELGFSSSAPQLIPRQVGSSAWEEVAAGRHGGYSVALRPDGSLWSWGTNTGGQLGNGQTVRRSPQPLAGTWSSVSGGYDFTLALRPNGTIWTWGEKFDALSNFDSLYINNQHMRRLPEQVGTASTWRTATAGSDHAVALRQDSTLWAWGTNTYGQFGNGTRTGINPASVQHLPAQPLPGSTWRAATASYDYTAAIRADGTLWAWGDNSSYLIGSNSNISYLIPTQIGTATWQSIATGVGHLVGIQANGTLWAWGNLLGIQQGYPVQVGTGTAWQSVAAGGNHALAVRADGTLWAWGTNTYGQLGIGNTTDQPSPVQVSPGTTWRSVAAGNSFTVAVRTDGTLWAWGINYYGQLGTGTTANALAPVQLGTATNWQRVTAGIDFAGALTTSGTLWMWGHNNLSQLGYPADTAVPQLIAGGTALATTPTLAPAEWSLAPNPAHAQVQLLGLPAGPVAVRVYDAQGRLVRLATEATVSTAGLAPGLYLLRATAAGQPAGTRRLVVE